MKEKGDEKYFTKLEKYGNIIIELNCNFKFKKFTFKTHHNYNYFKIKNLKHKSRKFSLIILNKR